MKLNEVVIEGNLERCAFEFEYLFKQWQGYMNRLAAIDEPKQLMKQHDWIRATLLEMLENVASASRIAYEMTYNEELYYKQSREIEWQEN